MGSKTAKHKGKIQLRAIEFLLELSKDNRGNPKPKYTFFIPAYQRGYRWTATEVTQLLDDIQEFTEKKVTHDLELYCLQPIVVKKMELSDDKLLDKKIKGEEVYEIIDGQQRLTTTYLILKWLNARYKEDYQKQLFQVLFETRDGSENYLNTLAESEKDKYIDYYYINNAYQTINTWFNNKMSNQKHIGELETSLLKYVKPIWYEIPTDSKSVEVFRALNVGKIKLTNFELIKALFLSKSNHSNAIAQTDLLQIAHDWEVISKALMDDAFWNFISNEKVEKFERIAYLFEIESLSYEFEISLDEKLRTFLLFQNELKDKNRIVVWKEFKKLFLILQSWYEDREMYHLIGYLIAIVKDNKSKNGLWELIKELRKESLEKDTLAFRKSIVDKIKRSLNLGQINYNNNKKKLRDYLLLFNIATLLEDEKSNVFFNFTEFKGEDWDIEHIKSVSSSMPANLKGQLKWMKGVLWYLTGEKFDNVSEELIEQTTKDEEQKFSIRLFNLCNSSSFEDTDFSTLYAEILNYFGEEENEEVDNSIGNLTLLDATTNRSYGNSIFPVKRKTIIDIESKGGFVPVCTKNVFLKLYNDRASNNFKWTEEDARKYQQTIDDKVTKLINSTDE